MARPWETSSSAGETAIKVNRVWWTRVLGASDRGDDESIPNTATLVNYADIGDAASITALAGPLYGELYVFKSRSIYKLVPTGDSTSPFAVVVVCETIGAVDQRVVAMGTNPNGGAAIFFADEHALHMVTEGGVTAISGPIARDLMAQGVDASEALMAYDPYLSQLLTYLSASPSTVSGNYKAFVFDALKRRWSGFSLGGAAGGWVLGSGALGTSTALAGLGATVRSATVGRITSTGTRRLIFGGQDADEAAALTNLGGQVGLDGSATYTSQTRIRKVVQPGYLCSAGTPTIFYRNPQGDTAGTLSCTLSYLRPSGPNGESTVVSETVTLTATTDENGIEVQQHTFESVAWADTAVLDVRLTLSYTGTAFSSAVTPTIDAVVIPVRVQEPLAR
jgi:hypothetical protein